MGRAVVPMCFWEDDGVCERKTTFPTVCAPGVNFPPAPALCRAKALAIPITLVDTLGSRLTGLLETRSQKYHLLSKTVLTPQVRQP